MGNKEVPVESSGGWGSALIEWLIMRVLTRLFPKRYRLIPRLDGEPMLRQFLVGRFSLGQRNVEIYLQSFLRGETTEWFHHHRWEYMRSIVLCGNFWEERFPGRMYLRHVGPSTYSMDFTTIHRIEYARPRTWSLFFGFNNKARWGYYRRIDSRVEYIPWEKMISEKIRVPSL